MFQFQYICKLENTFLLLSEYIVYSHVLFFFQTAHFFIAYRDLENVIPPTPQQVMVDATVSLRDSTLASRVNIARLQAAVMAKAGG